MSEIEKQTFKILLADDHSLIRQGVLFLLDDLEESFETFQVSNLKQILEKISQIKIDLAIIDAHFPDGNSISILAEIKKISPETKILIFTGIDEDSNALKYIKAGANGFLSKMSEEEEIKKAILKMLQDGEYISATTQALLLNSMRNPKLINPLMVLSERELQIAKMYAIGNGNLEIANLLEIKQNTVSTIKKRIFEKLEIDNIVELIELIKENDQ